MLQRGQIQPPPLTPWASVWAIGFDLGVLGVNLATTADALWSVMLTGGLLAAIMTLLVQVANADEAFRISSLKALTVGLAVVVPMPFAGTLLGAVMLGWAWFHHHDQKTLRAQ